MTEQQISTDQTDGATEPQTGFTAGYAQSDKRVYRGRIRVHADGTARVTFRGDVAGWDRIWVERGSSGRMSLYAEVEPTEDTATEVRLAVVPTGKRTPRDASGALAARVGSVGGNHVYLLGIGGVDRAEFDAAMEARRAEREARRAAWAAAQGDADDDGDDDFLRGLLG